VILPLTWSGLHRNRWSEFDGYARELHVIIPLLAPPWPPLLSIFTELNCDGSPLVFSATCEPIICEFLSIQLSSLEGSTERATV
jgi:hypothetical protein